MRRIRFVLLLLLAGLVVTGYFALRALGFFGVGLTARPVPKGDQEIAWISPATSSANWERFVAAVRRVAGERQLVVLETNAFPDQTAAVPEVGLERPGCKGRLWFRWYKMTSDLGSNEWVNELARRDPAPLAIIGGGTSDHARDLAVALADPKPQWHEEPPLLLLTTATADQVYLERENADRPLTQIYPGRTFRFCFTNRQMAEAVCDFIPERGLLRPRGSGRAIRSAICAAALAGPWPLLASLFAAEPPAVHAVHWADDPYSVDLVNQFADALQQGDYEIQPLQNFRVSFSVGSFYNPNIYEAPVIRRLVDAVIQAPRWQRQLLILPAMDRPARRILRALATAMPQEVRNVVALTGDSIPFNTVYRDRDLGWDVQEMPVPLIFFSHQDPVAWSPDPKAPVPRYGSATDEELLNADIVRLLVDEIFPQPSASFTGLSQLSCRAKELAERLHRREPAFFAADGNRLGGSGEYVVFLRPRFKGDIVLPYASVEVWKRVASGPDASRWEQVRLLRIDYAEAGDGGGAHGGS